MSGNDGPETSASALNPSASAFVFKPRGRPATPPVRLEKVVDEFVNSSTNGAADAEETSLYIAALLAKADFENGRFAAPARRAPKRSGKWVDWY